MRPVYFYRLLIPMAVFAPAAALAAAAVQSETPAQARVSVHYQDPHAFTESRLAGFGHAYDHGDYLQKLRTFLVRRATPMLAPGEHLTITFTNIKLAGSYEPWRGPLWSDVRFMRDIYQPRFDLTFTLTDADGQVLRKGTRKLADMAYLYDSSCVVYNDGPLCYDKAVLERWLRRGPANW